MPDFPFCTYLTITNPRPFSLSPLNPDRTIECLWSRSTFFRIKLKLSFVINTPEARQPSVVTVMSHNQDCCSCVFSIPSALKFGGRTYQILDWVLYITAAFLFFSPAWPSFFPEWILVVSF
jgi:hypothetical protein